MTSSHSGRISRAKAREFAIFDLVLLYFIAYLYKNSLTRVPVLPMKVDRSLSGHNPLKIGSQAI